jgi:hypothetical protein
VAFAVGGLAQREHRGFAEGICRVTPFDLPTLSEHVIAIKETLFELAKREYDMLRKIGES